MKTCEVVLQKSMGRPYMWSYLVKSETGSNVLSGGLYHSDYPKRDYAIEAIEKEVAYRLGNRGFQIRVK